MQYLFAHYSEKCFDFSSHCYNKRLKKLEKELLLKIYTCEACFIQKQSKLDKYLFEQRKSLE